MWSVGEKDDDGGGEGGSDGHPGFGDEDEFAGHGKFDDRGSRDVGGDEVSGLQIRCLNGVKAWW